MHLEIEIMIAKECAPNISLLAVDESASFFDSHLFFKGVVLINPFQMTYKNLLNCLLWCLGLTFLRKRHRIGFFKVR